MFFTKGDHPVHRSQQAVRELRVRYSAYQVEQGKAGTHRHVNLQRLTALMLVVAMRDPSLLSDNRKPMHIERVRREVVTEPLNVVACVAKRSGMMFPRSRSVKKT